MKHVTTAYPYDEFVGVNAPTGTPAYLMIETSHAKKIYCAKSQEDRAMWVDAIRKNGERAARTAITRQGSRSISKMTKQGSIFGGLFGGKRNSTASASDYLKSAERDELSAGSMLTFKSRPSMVRSERSASSSGSLMAAVPEVADEDLDDELQKMVGSLGLKGPQAAAVLNLPKEKKREMLKGFTLTQQQDKATPGKENEAKVYVNQLLDDPTLDELTEVGVWLATAPIAKVEQFIAVRGTESIAGVLTNLCRHASRGDGDETKVDAAMRCLKALVKTEPGLIAVIRSPSLVCNSFASGGGSLLLSETDGILELAVAILSTVAVYSTDGHRAVLAALEELYLFHATVGDVSERPKPFEPLVERLRATPRSKQHALVLTLLNAVVNGCPEMAQRIKMRDALADLGFIELTRALMTAIGDDIDLQIAVFDQEMHADIKELGGTAQPASVDLSQIPLAPSIGLPPLPPNDGRSRANSSVELSGAAKLALELTSKLGAGGTRPLETLLDALSRSAAPLATEADFWGALGVAATAGEGASVDALAAKLAAMGPPSSPKMAWEANYAEKPAEEAAEVAKLREELDEAKAAAAVAEVEAAAAKAEAEARVRLRAV